MVRYESILCHERVKYVSDESSAASRTRSSDRSRAERRSRQALDRVGVAAKQARLFVDEPPEQRNTIGVGRLALISRLYDLSGIKARSVNSCLDWARVTGPRSDRWRVFLSSPTWRQFHRSKMLSALFCYSRMRWRHERRHGIVGSEPSWLWKGLLGPKRLSRSSR